MVLDSTKSIQAVLAAAVASTPLAFTADYAASTTLPVGGSSPTNTATGSISGTTPTTMIPSPSNTKLYFAVLGFSIYNGDTSAAKVTVQINVSASLTTWYQATIQPGDNLFYNGATGSFYVVASDGSTRGITPLPLGAPSTTYLSSGQAVVQLSETERRILGMLIAEVQLLRQAFEDWSGMIPRFDPAQTQPTQVFDRRT